MQSSPSALLPARRIVAWTAIFLAVAAAANRLVRLFDKHVVHFDRPPFWPIGEITLSWPTGQAVLIAVGCICLFALYLYLLHRSDWPPTAVIAAALALTLATNVIHGTDQGLVQPIAGGQGPTAVQYYHDSLRIDDAWSFFQHFNDLQPTLLDHARTHPPGAVLVVHLLRRALENPALIALALAALSIIFLGAFFHGLSSRLQTKPEENPSPPVRLTFLLLILPAVQIYGLAGIDALIAALALGCVYFVLHPRPAVAVIGATAFLLATSMLTFAALFVLPVMLAGEWSTRRRIDRSLASVALVVAFYVLIAAAGFNYAAAFRTAACLENPAGFRLFSDPAPYLFTRAECAAEILLFLGPFLTVFFLRGLHQMKRTAAAPLVWTAIATLLAMFATGAFHTGETARACLFICPYLLLAANAHLRSAAASSNDLRRLAIVVFTQSLAMQLLGDYFW